MTLRLYLDGAGNIGPFNLLTNDSGHIEWSGAVPTVGHWQVHVVFDGLGVYLPSQTTRDVSVRLGTQVEVVVTSTGDVVAGREPLNVSILLTDTEGAPLEGRTVYWDAYHDMLGIVWNGSLIQQGHSPEPLSITLPIMGNYSILFYFKGTENYHSSNTALRQWVLGLSQIVIHGATSIDRSIDSFLMVEVLDELGTPIDLADLPLMVELYGQQVSFDHSERVTWKAKNLTISTLGLETGSYIVNLTVAQSAKRLGSVLLYHFNITAATYLVEASRSLSGLLGDEHSISLVLMDSFDEPVQDITLWISLYDPIGREVYGSLLTEQTPIDTADGSIRVTWNPSLTGNYTLMVSYVGDGWNEPTVTLHVVLIRRATYLELEGTTSLHYPETMDLSITLTGGLGKITGASLHVLDILEGKVVYDSWVVTGSWGFATVDFGTMLSGEHNITVLYEGTETFAPCRADLETMVYPRVDIEINPKNVDVGKNSTMKLTLNVQGVSWDWEGVMKVLLMDPNKLLLHNVTFKVSPETDYEMHLILLTTGVHRINATLFGLPLDLQVTESFEIMVNMPMVEIQLDAGSGPVAGGGVLASIIGVILWRRKEKLLALPSEWD